MTAAFLWLIALSVWVPSQVLWLTRRIPTYVSYGLDAVAHGFASVAAITGGERVMAVWFAGLCAFSLYAWWHRGGGDGTRRRLRALRGVFRGVRRTAPVTGGAS